VSLMVGDLARGEVLVRHEDETDRRRRIVSIAPAYAPAIERWLSGTAIAWTEALSGLTPAQRRTVVDAMRAYEDALGRLDQSRAEAAPDRVSTRVAPGGKLAR
jgi:DNA-binding MarR family transcriptional regulator